MKKKFNLQNMFINVNNEKINILYLEAKPDKYVLYQKLNDSQENEDDFKRIDSDENFVIPFKKKFSHIFFNVVKSQKTGMYELILNKKQVYCTEYSDPIHTEHENMKLIDFQGKLFMGKREDVFTDDSVDENNVKSISLTDDSNKLVEPKEELIIQKLEDVKPDIVSMVLGDDKKTLSPPMKNKRKEKPAVAPVEEKSAVAPVEEKSAVASTEEILVVSPVEEKTVVEVAPAKEIPVVALAEEKSTPVEEKTVVEVAPAKEIPVVAPVEEKSTPVEEKTVVEVAPAEQKVSEIKIESNDDAPLSEEDEKLNIKIKEIAEEIKREKSDLEHVLNKEFTIHHIISDFYQLEKEIEEGVKKNMEKKVEIKNESNEKDLRKMYKTNFQHNNTNYSINTIKLEPLPKDSNIMKIDVHENNIINTPSMAFEIDSADMNYLILYNNVRYLINKTGNLIVIINLYNKNIQKIKSKDSLKMLNNDYILYNTVFIPMENKKIFNNDYGTSFNLLTPKI